MFDVFALKSVCWFLRFYQNYLRSLCWSIIWFDNLIRFHETDLKVCKSEKEAPASKIVFNLTLSFNFGCS